MQAPSYTLQEDLRQQAVDSYHIVDTEPEEQFDNLTELAIQICGVQHALLTFLDKDRNWYNPIITYRLLKHLDHYHSADT